jgi:FtsP/CotA-like multicopper oxidase with cupredoxin domain
VSLRSLRNILILSIVCLVSISSSFLSPAAIAGADTAQTAKPGVKKFHLYATDGYLTLPDGEKVYIWGYSLENKKGTAVYPAPKLEVEEGDTVEVTLTNIGPVKEGIRRVAHTIHWHGLDTDQENDGVPDTSPAIQTGESFTYRFTATHAGTYFYHCHVDTIEHLQMGMHGSLVVKAKGGVKQAWTGGPAYDKEYVFHLNEIDPVWHKAVEEGKKYDRTQFHPRYWTINGKAYPDTMKDPQTMIQGKVGETVLIRLINAGYEEHPFHLHGHHFKVIASDGRPLPAPIEKDTINIGPGERYDILVTFTQSGEFPFHSHKIIDNTNNGVYPGGLHTMTSITGNDQQSANQDAGHGVVQQTVTQPVGSSATATLPAEGETVVYIEASAYSQKELRIKKGTKVTWINKDTQIHTVTELNNLFDSGNMLASEKWSHTFEKAGTFVYYCTTHPSMEAKVIVE